MVTLAATTASVPGLALLLLLGLRHGLDPDHVAVIDNLTFRASEERPRWSPWVGFLFALGHSASVAVIAVGVSLIAGRFSWPGWAADVIDWAAIGLLIVVGVLNLRALKSSNPYVPAGWRQGLAPRALRGTSHPAAIFAIGIIFGLVFDTATQAAAWGMAASSRSGVLGAVVVSAVFACGMIATDTADSQIVTRLLRSGGDVSKVRRYRRGVGWLIVGLSFGMAGYALATKLSAIAELPDAWFSIAGATMALAVVLMLGVGRHRLAERRQRA